MCLPYSKKGRVHPQIICLYKFILNPTIIITNSTLYNRYMEIILITGGYHLNNIRAYLDELYCNNRKYAFVLKIHVWLTPVYIDITGSYKQLVLSDSRIQEHPDCVWLNITGVYKPLIVN